MKTLMNDKFKVAYEKMLKKVKLEGYSVTDLVTHLHREVLQVQMPSKAMIFLLDKLSDIEHHLSYGASEKLQLGSLVGAFQIAKEICASGSKMSD